ncbi:MAG: hypothetical protein IPM29_24060 [Planctomycetes bacterium]|nr:hypothetical protein [Planctomycetota bacterium]
MPQRRLDIGFAGTAGADRPHLSVDGMTPAGPNLSHWPGNRTPAVYKRDLSTGICLAFAADDAGRRAAFLGDAELVLNDHYDTDGFLSMLAVVRPEVALPREEVLLAAAATGDFQAWQTVRGFAIDRIVAGIADASSPVAAEFAGLSGPAKSLARYRWLVDHAELVLDRPDHFAALWRDSCDAQLAELRAARTGALERWFVPAAALAVVRSDGPLRRMTVNTLAGGYRVLHVDERPDGPRYRYHDRTETWFEVATFVPPARRDLRPLARRLQELEGDRGDPRFGWHADAPDQPVPELWFGADTPQAYGEVTRELAPSRLATDRVRDLLTAHLALA